MRGGCRAARAIRSCCASCRRRCRASPPRATSTARSKPWCASARGSTCGATTATRRRKARGRVRKTRNEPGRFRLHVARALSPAEVDRGHRQRRRGDSLLADPGAAARHAPQSRKMLSADAAAQPRAPCARLFPRQASVRESLRAIALGAIYYYLPDLDFGRRRSVFVPFFGVPAATVTGLSYIARFTAASVVPCVTRMLPGGKGYVARLYPAWTGFPSGDDMADARRLMSFVEERVLEMPEQYFWLHKRLDRKSTRLNSSHLVIS